MEIKRTTHEAIAHLRDEFLRENNVQFVLDKCHRYGWADVYSFNSDGSQVGYGSAWGKEKRDERDTIFEFYLIREHRQRAEKFFSAFCEASKVLWVECQSNDQFLYPMFKKFAKNVKEEAILFADHKTTSLHIANTSLLVRQNLNPDDRQYLLIRNGATVGEGGFMLNYNLPYADMYYSINEEYRRQGFGSYFVQELKTEIYKIGRVPAARCNPANAHSKATLLKAGMVVCAHRLSGEILFQ